MSRRAPTVCGIELLLGDDRPFTITSNVWSCD